jgi:hypothetical protein
VRAAVNVCLMCSILHIPRLPSPDMHFLILCECDSYVYSGRPNTSASQLHGLELESSFMLFAKWKNLSRLKLECLEHIGSGKFFIQVNVIYIYI